MSEAASRIKVIAFDVFGTVVDWHGSIMREVERLGLGIDADEFALAWRREYVPAMQTVMDQGEWVILDVLHRRILDGVLARFGLDSMTETERRELNLAWHRLDPWPDSVAGLDSLRSRYIVCTLSNGNIGLLTEMAKRAGLPWDCILSAENFGKYKPHPDTYLGVARIFDVRPDEVMLAAAHQADLDAARGCGLATAYIERPLEFGAKHPKDIAGSRDNTFHAADIPALASQLGCDSVAGIG
ncbi:MAG: haloacid dehalogenase type II [Pseudomonadales bacterium]|nr:haloacid dehalogenase type II [Pseudomonadales bacterium]